MCGIVVVIDSLREEGELRTQVIELARTIRHRGPDWSGVAMQVVEDVTGKVKRRALAHERLGIVSPEAGAQPLFDESGSMALAVNGEIYNHVMLKQSLKGEHRFVTGSDCEVIVHLYEERGPELVAELDGVFAFVLSDQKTGRVLAARDPMGVVPLYWGWGEDGSTWFASELKALEGVCERFEPFPPGHRYADGELTRYYEPAWRERAACTAQVSPEDLRGALEKSVVKRLMCDVPYGVLLSGGLDSSLVAAIAARHAARRVEDDECSAAWWPRLHSFCVGLKGSPDLAAAREVAEMVGTVHHELTFTIQEGLDALRDVIYHIESYDITTVRASTPMFLMARKIKAMGIKMVLSGEGADEVFGGYLYFHKAPDADELHAETIRKVFKLHHYDCLRANKAMAAWGVEARVPFLDREFLDVAMSLDPAEKMPDLKKGKMEKHVLRAAFDTQEDPYLPESVLWRQKEQFSDGVGYSWIDALRDHADALITDEVFAAREARFANNPPPNKEGYLYRKIFEELFPHPSAVAGVPAEKSIACSSPTALRWEKEWADKADPSGRAILSHAAAYED
ncbi:MAG: asparagine synthase B [Deltaproteobacteria bacterium]|nr:asparagine synthase B [Deltaproteobacteria bacterium]